MGGITFLVGENIPVGTFSDYFSYGPSASLGILIHTPYFYKYLFSEGTVTFNKHSLHESPNSHLTMYSLGLATGIFYPLGKYIVPYGSIGIQESCLVFNAHTTNKTVTEFSPMAFLQGGIAIPLYSQFFLRCNVTFTIAEISHERFSSISFSIGGMLNYPPNMWRIGSPYDTAKKPHQQENADDLYKEAQAAAEAGEIEKAEDLLKKIFELNPQHQPSKELQNKFLIAKENYNKATLLINEKKYFAAIAPLELSLPYIKSASKDLLFVRSKLINEIPYLEKVGIEAYQNKDYNRCIIIMNKIKTIDPKNEIVEMYLPRAIKRKEAIERLK
ncbi:MAG: porin family protein [Spirochaetes bacterium]|nr:porin family protein [Spirochaetota bacterium]